jgi:hypothetical protein
METYKAADLHPMFQDLLKRTDGWTDDINQTSLDYNFMTRHPTMSILFLTLLGVSALAGNIGNILVSVPSFLFANAYYAYLLVKTNFFQNILKSVKFLKIVSYLKERKA